MHPGWRWWQSQQTFVNVLSFSALLTTWHWKPWKENVSDWHFAHLKHQQNLWDAISLAAVDVRLKIHTRGYVYLTRCLWVKLKNSDILLWDKGKTQHSGCEWQSWWYWCAFQVLTAIRKAAEQLSYSTLDVISKPYHDAAVMGVKVPVAMIFIPSRKGLSHHPDEFSSPEQVEAGVKTLALAIAHLAESTDSSKTELWCVFRQPEERIWTVIALRHMDCRFCTHHASATPLDSSNC